MPGCKLFGFKIYVGDYLIPEYCNSDQYFCESDLSTPHSYNQLQSEEVNGQGIEKQQMPVTPYKILLYVNEDNDSDLSIHHYYKCYVDGVKVKGISLAAGQEKIISGFKDGNTVREFLFSMPRFAKDINDRLSEELVSKVGTIGVECWTATLSKSKFTTRKRKLKFKQANKKDSSRVTHGNFTMVTSKAGKSVKQREQVRLVDTWKKGHLVEKLCLNYRMGHTLVDMGITLDPKPWGIKKSEEIPVIVIDDSDDEDTKPSPSKIPRQSTSTPQVAESFVMGNQKFVKCGRNRWKIDDAGNITDPEGKYNTAEKDIIEITAPESSAKGKSMRTENNNIKQEPTNRGLAKVGVDVIDADFVDQKPIVTERKTSAGESNEIIKGLEEAASFSTVIKDTDKSKVVLCDEMQDSAKGSHQNPIVTESKISEGENDKIIEDSEVATSCSTVITDTDRSKIVLCDEIQDSTKGSHSEVDVVDQNHITTESKTSSGESNEIIKDSSVVASNSTVIMDTDEIQYVMGSHSEVDVGDPNSIVTESKTSSGESDELVKDSVVDTDRSEVAESDVNQDSAMGDCIKVDSNGTDNSAPLGILSEAEKNPNVKTGEISDQAKSSEKCDSSGDKNGTSQAINTNNSTMEEVPVNEDCESSSEIGSNSSNKKQDNSICENDVSFLASDTSENNRSYSHTENLETTSTVTLPDSDNKTNLNAVNQENITNTNGNNTTDSHTENSEITSTVTVLDSENKKNWNAFNLENTTSENANTGNENTSDITDHTSTNDSEILVRNEHISIVENKEKNDNVEIDVEVLDVIPADVARVVDVIDLETE